MSLSYISHIQIFSDLNFEQSALWRNLGTVLRCDSISLHLPLEVGASDFIFLIAIASPSFVSLFSVEWWKHQWKQLRKNGSNYAMHCHHYHSTPENNGILWTLWKTMFCNVFLTIGLKKQTNSLNSDLSPAGERFQRAQREQFHAGPQQQSGHTGPQQHDGHPGPQHRPDEPPQQCQLQCTLD